MKKHSVTIATVVGCLLIALDVLNGQPGAALISGCILLGAALIATHSRP